MRVYGAFFSILLDLSVAFEWVQAGWTLSISTASTVVGHGRAVEPADRSHGSVKPSAGLSQGIHRPTRQGALDARELRTPPETSDLGASNGSSWRRKRLPAHLDADGKGIRSQEIPTSLRPSYGQLKAAVSAKVWKS
jgi:hypothetical protein